MKTIAITGTTSGIGKAIALEFITEKWNVLELNRPEFDVTDIIKIMSYEFPEMDVFVNNAGIMPLVDFAETRLRHWNAIIKTNLMGPFFLCQRVIPKIKDGGCLINIASVSGLQPDPEEIAYSISKAGLLMLTRCLAKRCSGRIRVNAISPGFIITDLVEGDTPEHLVNRIPMKREGEPEEVAHLVRNIVDMKYLSGANIVLDGGLLVGTDGY